MSSSPPDQSDDWNGLSDHGDEDSESSASDSETAPDFFDLEASEDGSDEQQSDDDGSFASDDGALPYFPKFMELPPELREMVWNAFCPDLDGRPRVFEVLILDGSASAQLLLQHPQQTDPIRTIKAIHRESRDLALKVSPHNIVFPDEQPMVPCHHQKDILMMQFLDELVDETSDSALVLIADHLSQFRNIALAKGLAADETFFPSFLSVFDNLTNIYIVDEAEEQYGKALAWCTSGKTYEYSFSFVEDSSIETSGPPVQMTYVWPNVKDHRRFADREFPTLDIENPEVYDVFLDNVLDHMEESGFVDWDEESIPVAFNYMRRGWAYSIIRYRRIVTEHFGMVVAPPGDEEAAEICLGVWPMARFMFESGQERLDDLKGRQEPWTDWPLSPFSESGRPSLPDAYESDGIDDDEIDDHLSTDEEDDLPAHLLSDSDIDGSDMLGQSTELSGLETARFSSNSDAGSSPSDTESSSHGYPYQAFPRIIELDSEDESSNDEGSNDETESGPTDTSHHPTHIINDESEDEDGEEELRSEPPRGVKRRARAMLVDSEDEDDQNNNSAGPSRAAKRRARPAIPSDSEDGEDTKTGKIPDGVPTETNGATTEDEEESSSDDDDDDEPAPPKRVSLAKRLQMEYKSSRAVRPTDSSDDEGADGQSYSGASDDDEGDEDDTDGGGMVTGMAEEGDEQEDEDDIDGW